MHNHGTQWSPLLKQTSWPSSNPVITVVGSWGPNHNLAAVFIPSNFAQIVRLKKYGPRMLPNWKLSSDLSYTNAIVATVKLPVCTRINKSIGDGEFFGGLLYTKALETTRSFGPLTPADYSCKFAQYQLRIAKTGVLTAETSLSLLQNPIFQICGPYE